MEFFVCIFETFVRAVRRDFFEAFLATLAKKVVELLPSLVSIYPHLRTIFDQRKFQNTLFETKERCLFLATSVVLKKTGAREYQQASRRLQGLSISTNKIHGSHKSCEVYCKLNCLANKLDRTRLTGTLDGRKMSLGVTTKKLRQKLKKLVPQCWCPIKIFFWYPGVCLWLSILNIITIIFYHCHFLPHYHFKFICKT